MTVFYTTLNTAGINSQIVYTGSQNKIRSSRKFLRKFAMELLTEQLERRHKNNTRLPATIALALKKRVIKNKTVSPVDSEERGSNSQRMQCEVCRKEKRSQHFYDMVNFWPPAIAYG